MNQKVLQLCFGDGYAGSAKMAVLSSELLSLKGVDVLFLASDNSLTEKRSREKGINTLSLNTRKPFTELKQDVFKVFSEYKPSVVITHHSLERKCGISLRRKFKNSFTNIAYRHNLSQSVPIIGALLYNIYFDYLIACGTGVGKSLTSAGINKNKVKVIHYGIEVPDNINDISGTDVRSKYNLDEKTVVGVSAWFHKERKGFDILFKAFAKLDNSFLLFIIGIPENMQEIVWQYASEFNTVKERIIMPGYVENIFEYYKAMDLFVFPSRSEGFPLAPLEAGICKLPVIASKIPGTDEFISTGLNGILYSTEDYNALAESIKKVASDKSLIKNYGENAYNTVMDKYTSTTYMENLFNFITNLPEK